MDAERLLGALSDNELAEVLNAAPAELERRGMELPVSVGNLATKGTTELSAVSPNLNESLIESFDQAYQTYGFLVGNVNAARTESAETKGRKKDKPTPLEIVDADTIRTDVEALLSNEAVMAELQADIDYFTANPETGSPAPGFELVIIPEGLAETDEQAIARGVQAKITTDYTPYIRPSAYNDQRTPEVTGKGCRIVLAPTHYNVPSGTAAAQKSWMEAKNSTGGANTATELQTATDTEALAFINTLADTKQLDNPDTRFDQTYFKRFDQAPRGGSVSRVYVSVDGRLVLGVSLVHDDFPTRALVVPKA